MFALAIYYDREGKINSATPLLATESVSTQHVVMVATVSSTKTTLECFCSWLRNTLASSMVRQIYSSRRTSSSSDLSYSNLIFTVITNLVRNNKLALRSICILKKWGMILSLGRITTDKVWGSSIEYTVVLSAAGFQVSRWILKTFQVDFCTPHGLD